MQHATMAGGASSSLALHERAAAESITLGNNEVLSRSGALEASGEQAKLLCLLSDGRLIVARGQGNNPHVLSYCARLERLVHAFTISFSDIGSIAQLYRSGNAGHAGRRQEHSMMQVTAKELLTRACEARASDVHIRLRRTSTEIYFRIHNDLILTGSQTAEHGARLQATLYGTMTSVSDSSYKPTERQDASIADRDKLPPILYGVRIATTPTSEGVLMVLRLLYNDAGDHIDLRPLGFEEHHAAMLQRLKEQPIGMNIISGPTGSGKSTTLQRILSGQILESAYRLHVLTVEDPVEYPIDGAVQTSVINAANEEERARMFSSAIANALRLDPDTIMIGEMRDAASAQSALRAAMTGHQLWTTVHANSALAIIDRLSDLGLPLSMVTDPSLVTGLISQRLVKLLCPHCKLPLVEVDNALSFAQRQRLNKALPDGLQRVCIAGAGCDACAGLGTVGRTVVAEIILPDEHFFRFVRAGEKSAALRYWQENLDGRTMLAHTLSKVARGLVDPRMAEKVVGHLGGVGSSDMSGDVIAGGLHAA